MSPARGLVADLVRFSSVDGPGNRLVVFLQGCTFDCLTCHNPQTIPRQSRAARVMSVPDLLGQVREVAPFLSGVTVSGGEATTQPEFLGHFFAAIKADVEPAVARLTTFVDSNGSAPLTTWDALAPVMDSAMVDLKALDAGTHERLTGQPNDGVLASIRHLAGLGKLYEVRLLLVPGVNDDAATLARTAAWLLDVDPAMRVKVIGLRHHGVRAAGRRFPESTEPQRAEYGERLRQAGVRTLVVV